MKPMELTPDEVDQCYEWGQIRTRESKDRQDNHGLRIVTDEDKRKDRIRQMVGVLGEYVAGLTLTGEYTFHVNTFQAPDVLLDGGWDVEVKSSQKRSSLVVRPNAKCNDIYVMAYVNLETPTYVGGADVELVGWTTPHEARLLSDHHGGMIQDRQNRGAPAVFLPVEHLRNMSTLVPEHVGEAVQCEGCPHCRRRPSGR